ncbi:MAG TPA: hypothetical protein VFO39_02390 [Candidatus Sulfotelmatobacter sp.]|nr:hypothetical protein [Candidatus Sulfotelmatobacter sp.]
MTRKTLLRLLIVVLSLLLADVRQAAGRGQASRSGGESRPQPADVRGTWSGTFYSKHSNVVPFTITVQINADSRGRLVGASTLSSDCLKGAQLQITVNGSQVILAGSDEDGDNITVRSTIDSTGTRLKSSYILNGSATGRCETDDGTGDLMKR